VLARWPRLGQLLTLDVRNNRIGDVGVRDLAAAASACRLRELDLSHNDVSDAGAQALVASGLVERIGKLHLNDNAVAGVLASVVR
jgi:hypothetical protein